jgi:hypothetical protein
MKHTFVGARTTSDSRHPDCAIERRRSLRWRSILPALGVPLMTGCAVLGSLAGGVKDAGKIAGGCPDLSTVDAIAKIDFVDEFSLDPLTAAKVKAAVMATSDLSSISASIDGDLKTGCAGLAKSLGAGGDFKSGSEACQAAMTAIRETKAKIGAKVSVAVTASPPVCSAALDSAADCAGKCDANLKGAKADVKCEGGDLSGVCDGDCTGKCALSAPAACSGTCSGSCDASFSGTCGGTCEGKCDGANSSGPCKGTCEGRCDAGGSGTCAGQCSGTCQAAGAAKCGGTCSGSCSVAFKEPKCSGKVEMPAVSPECKASCDTHASLNLDCTRASIDVKIVGAEDAEAAARYKAALEANLPVIMKVALGVGPKLVGVVLDAKTTILGGIAVGQSVVKARPTASAHVVSCLLNRFTSAIDAVGSIQADVKVSVDVNASASATGGTG